MLVHRGTLRVGDAIVAGDASGKVRALYDYLGEKVKEARPGEPVEILGFDRPPPAGELARVVEHERQAKDLAQKRAERLRREQLAQRSKRGVSLESLFTQMQEGVVQDLNIVLKGDVQGSVEALLGELGKIHHSEVRVNVIHTGVGGITENDVNLASASNALVIGFNVRPSAEARALAEREGVDIRTYRVIYQLTDEIQQALVGNALAGPDRGDDRRGRGARAVQGLAARHDRGLHGHDGVVRRNAQVRVVRDGTVIYDTSISQLKRFKDDAREVSEGFECGILLDGYNDLKEGDILEAYETRQVERTDLDEVGAHADVRRPWQRAACRRRRRGVIASAVSAVSRSAGFDELGECGCADAIAVGGRVDAVAPEPPRVRVGERLPVEDTEVRARRGDLPPEHPVVAVVRDAVVRAAGRRSTR